MQQSCLKPPGITGELKIHVIGYLMLLFVKMRLEFARITARLEWIPLPLRPVILPFFLFASETIQNVNHPRDSYTMSEKAEPFLRLSV